MTGPATPTVPDAPPERAVAGFSSFAELVAARARERPDQIVFSFLKDGEEEAEDLTYGELLARVEAVTAALAAHGAAGERALLLYPSGLELVVAFLGCLAAGVVAVPVYPPRSPRALPRLAAILADARPRLALTTSALEARLTAWGARLPGLADLPLLATDDLSAADAEWTAPPLTPASVAFLQYTSGSTAAPKGVVVSHGNLLHNQEMIRRGFGQDEASVIVSWLPLYHDMGLIGGVLQPLYVGARAVLFSPAAFLQRPRRWLEAISRYRATTSGGPNFAYDLCAGKIGDPAGLDLSSWTVAFNGAEPVRAETLARFTATFAGAGFRAAAFYPCYGLAEATLFVAGGAVEEAPRVAAFDAPALEAGEARPAEAGGKERRLVACGRPAAGLTVEIVDPSTGQRAAPGRIGEIWVAGPSVAGGYWGQAEAAAAAFGARLADESEAGPFLRTGDLGFAAHGELWIAGRLKDLIILRGRNLYPQDVERAAEAAHPALTPGASAAFAVERDGAERGERLVVVAELARAWRSEPPDVVARQVRRAVAEELEAAVFEVLLLPPGAVPRTSSGKVRRGASRAAWLAGEWQPLGRSPAAGEGEEPGEWAPADGADLAILPLAERRAALLDLLCREVARAARLPTSAVSPTAPAGAAGLDSLAAVEVAGRLSERLGHPVTPAELLGDEGLAELADRWAAGPPPAVDADASPDAAVALRAEPALSEGQRALWFLDRLRPGNAAYNLAGAVRLSPPVDAAALERAVAALVRRHAALATTFEADENGEPFRRVHPEPADPWQRVAATGWSQEELTAALERAAARPFDLAAGPLLRVTLFDGPEGPVLLWVVHHLAADFTSLAVLARELGALYGAAAGETAALPPLPYTYDDFVRWQRRRLAGAEGERLWDFWRGELAGAPLVLELAADRPRRPEPTGGGAAVFDRFPPAAGAAVRAFAGRGGTLFTTTLAGFAALLHRLTGVGDLVVGTPAAGRTAPAWEGICGYFVNPVPLRLSVSADEPFAALAARARRVTAAALAHQDFPFPRLAARLDPERDAGRPPVFQVMLLLQPSPPGQEGVAALALGLPGVPVELGGIAGRSLPGVERTAQLDLALSLAVVEGGLAASLRYDADLFDAATARRLLGGFLTLLAAAAEHADRPAGDLPLLAPAEAHQILREWNDSGGAPAHARVDAGLYERFAEQARATPDIVALVAGADHLAYGELEGRARRLAGRLAALGVGPETRVGVLAGRSPAMVVALLGILAAGGAYVALDPAHPRERLAFVLGDAAVAVLCADRRGLAALAGTEIATPVVDLEAALAEVPPPLAGSGWPVPAACLAYVLYTSGSTGTPKGVAIARASAVALVRWALAFFSRAETARVLAATSIGFDLSVFELFVPLAAGGTVVLVENLLALADGPQEVTLINTVPSVLAELLELAPLPAATRVVNLAGEPLSRALAARVIAAAPPGCRLCNLYGPSEDTTYSTWEVVVTDGMEPAIGRPLPGSRAYVLDHRLRPLPPGIPGELHLAGLGLARGYWRRPEQTALAFRPDAESGEAGGRIYSTGDLARFRPDGRLDFLGRRDHQVKLRGFRIELGEVEAALAAHPEVREAAVAVHELAPGAPGLVAYVVAQASPGPAAGDLRAALAARLPAYMVPAVVVELAALPRTATGKLDRRALARPAAGGEAGAAGPLTAPLEELLAGLWGEVLGRQRVGREDHFFHLGGHSLLAVQLAARVRRRLGIELPLRDVFAHPTLAGLAAHLTRQLAAGRAADAEPPLVPVARDRPLLLSFAQERFWFLAQLEPESPGSNMPGGLDLAGPLDPARLAWALSQVVERHEILRTRLTGGADGPRQEALPPAAVALPVADLAALPAAAAEGEAERLARQEARRAFDLASGWPLRALLLRLPAADAATHRLLLTLHHVAADGWSLGLLLDELLELYGAAQEGRAARLPPLPVQYADFAVWQRTRLAVNALAGELDFWRAELAGLPVLELPADRPRPGVRSQRGARADQSLPAELTAAVGRLAREEGATPFLVLVAALAAHWSRLSGQDDFAVGLPVAGRGRPEVEPLIGCFVNTLVLRVRLDGDPDLPAFLGRVRAAFLAADAHRELPFERLVEELQPVRDLSRPPLVPVLCALQNVPWSRRQVGELAVSPLTGDAGTAAFDLSVFLAETEAGWHLTFEHDADLFDRTTGLRMAAGFGVLLAEWTAAPGAPLSRLTGLGAAERHQIVHEWRGILPAAPGSPFPERFAAQAAQRPDGVALVEDEADGAHVSYGELARRAGRLARRLSRLGIGPEAIVGLHLPRGEWVVVGLLGILAAGGACLPLDPEQPDERLGLLLRDSGIRWVVTGRRGAARLAGAWGVACLDPDGEPDVNSDAAAGADDGPAPPAVHSAQLACVIYTSGSTGQPQGVALPHGAVGVFLQGSRATHGIAPGDRVLWHSALSSGAGIVELLTPLAYGATVAVLHDPLPPASAGLSGVAVGVFDRTLAPLPVGAAGELALGGASLARGYLGRPEQTALRFVPDPAAGEPGARIYRTGDRARFLPDGRIDLLGRLDRQALPLPAAVELAAGGPALGFEEKLLATLWEEVLGRRGIAASDDFFALGGHSLLATRLLSRVRRSFGVEVPMRALFEAPTLAGFAARLAAARRGPEKEGTTPPPPLSPTAAADGSLPPLSFSQQRLWFLDQLEPGSPRYHIAAAVRLAGPLDAPRLGRCLELVIERHAALRTRFVQRDGSPVQEILPPEPLPLPRVDLMGLPAAGRQAEGTRLARFWVHRPFDLATDLPLRAALLRHGEGEHALLLSIHHIAADGWSLGVLLGEVGEAYTALGEGRAPALPPLPVQYADFALWQRGWLQGAVLDRLLDAWRRQLLDVPALELPTDRPRPPVRGWHGAGLVHRLPLALARDLASLARHLEATPFMVALAGFQVLLARLSGQGDFAVGTLVAGRNHREIEPLIGFFVNTLPLRARLDEGNGFDGAVRQARAVSLAAHAHQDLPFERLVEELAPERDLAHAPLVQALFSLQNAAMPPLALPGLELALLPVAHEATRFDLSLALTEIGETDAGLEASFTWATDLFDRVTVRRWAETFEGLLTAAVAAPALPWTDLPLLSAAARWQVLGEWNDAALPASDLPSLPRSFARQAGLVPDAPAARLLGAANAFLTYGELARRSGRLARRLRRLGVGPEVPVAICAEPSLELLAGLLGILTAGGAYVPLDPLDPPARLAWVLEDARPRVLLTQGAQRARLAGLPEAERPAFLLLDDADAGDAGGESDSGEGLPPPAPGQLAYVFYTSGSTGRPKGVPVEHGSLARYLAWAAAVLLDQPATTMPLLSRISFDASVKQLFTPWLLGRPVCCIPPAEATLPAALLGALGDVPALALNAVPALWEAMAGALARGEAPPPPGIRRLILGGDRLRPELAALSAELLPGIALYNVYGPTETTVNAACGVVARPARVTLGRPAAGARLYVLDRGFAPVLPGVPGELAIGGRGVARGFLGRPAETARSFVPDLFSGTPGGRLYRSGDLVRHRPDGEIEFLGRLDHQVKIRGLRVELGEIEAALAAHPAVGEAAVLLDRPGDGGERLVAWYAPADGSGDAGPAPGELRAFLRRRLSEAFLPAVFGRLPRLPRLSAGKLDRRALAALPLPDTAAPVDAAPLSESEEIVAGIWAELLERPAGRDDDFFALGGHSLLATRAVSRLRAAFGVELPLRSLFDAPTPRALAGVVERALAAGAGLAAPPLVRRAEPGDAPLSFAQQQLWLLHRLDPGSPTYNVPADVTFTGRLDAGALAAALALVVERHEVLRTTFPAGADGGEPQQRVAAPTPPALPLVDLAGLAEPAGEAARLGGALARLPFDLRRGPLLRAALVRLGDDRHRLLLDLHHIVIDGWSLGLLIRELAEGYGAAVAGRPARLPALPCQYGDFASWQRGWQRGPVLERQLAFWRERLAGAPRSLALPVDRPPRARPGAGGAVRAFPLPSALAPHLAALARRSGATLYMVLLAAFAAFLERATGQGDLLVGSPVAARNRAEIEGLIGFFVNLLVLRLAPGHGPFAELVARAREVALAAYVHQEVPFVTLVEALGGERHNPLSPLVQVLFAVQPSPLGTLELPGLALAAAAPDTGTAKFDLSCTITPAGDELRAAFEYRRELFDAPTIERLGRSFAALLAGLAAEPERPVAEVPWLDPAERFQLAREWNDTAEALADAAPVSQLFARHAAADPGAPAILADGGAWTYGELAGRARALARRLGRLGLPRESAVAVLLERGVDLVAAFVGILEAGGVYLPIDPTYPPARVALLLEDAAAPVVVTRRRLADLLGEAGGVEVVWVEDLDLAPEGGEARPAPVLPGQLAYVIYTSGSTGRPKGVAIPHAALAGFAAWLRQAFALGPGARASLLVGVSFDVSVWEIWGTLAAGACLLVPDEETRLTPERLAAWLAARGATHCFLPTPLAEAMLESPRDTGALRYLFAGGERLRRFPPAGAGFTLVNVYGPAECTVVASVARIPPRAEALGALPAIGRPIANTAIHLLDPEGEPVPIGVGGEICIGGEGLARGYRGRPDQTALRFVPSPFADGGRLYRTGDLARARSDGTLEFLGRLDHQVKVRGHRIEPGEIEAMLALHPAVGEAVAVLAESPPREPRLVAYVVPRGGLDPGELRDYLAARLPAFLVPARFVLLAALPLTGNGKIDRRALPAAEEVEAPFAAPRTAVEEVVAGLWEQLFGLPRIGRDDDFFALGGHSLLATRVAARLGQVFKVELPLESVFRATTVGELARAVEERERVPGQSERIARLVRQLQQMPVEEARARWEKGAPWTP